MEMVTGETTSLWCDPWIGSGVCDQNLGDVCVNSRLTITEMRSQGWGVEEYWSRWRCLFAWREEQLNQCAFLLDNVFLQDNVMDIWIWCHNSS